MQLSTTYSICTDIRCVDAFSSSILRNLGRRYSHLVEVLEGGLLEPFWNTSTNEPHLGYRLDGHCHQIPRRTSLPHPEHSMLRTIDPISPAPQLPDRLAIE